MKARQLKDLRPADYNPRFIEGVDYRALLDSIKDYGDLSGLVYNERSGNIVGGHQRKEAYHELGGGIEILETLDKPNSVGTIARGFVTIGDEKYTYRVVDWPMEKEKAANLAANKIQGEFDDDKLAKIIFDLKDEAVLQNTGFSENEVTAILATVMDVGGEDEAELKPPEPGEVQTKFGDLWHLGDSRLFCGDATDAGHMDALMGSQKAAMVFTDPPYNIDYDGGAAGDWAKKSRRKRFANDSMRPSEFKAWLQSVLVGLVKNTKGAFYICGHPSSQNLLYDAFIEAGGKWSAWVIWAKHHYTLSGSDYQHQYEPVLYGLSEDEARAIDEAQEGQYDSTPILYGWARHHWYGGRKQSDVWLIDRPTRNEHHPTEKPVSLPAKAIRNSSKRGEIVLDVFGGSGSTLIAAEQLQRRGYIMEISPAYCDVIISRWETLTGKKAILSMNYKNGDTFNG